MRVGVYESWNHACLFCMCCVIRLTILSFVAHPAFIYACSAGLHARPADGGRDPRRAERPHQERVRLAQPLKWGGGAARLPAALPAAPLHQGVVLGPFSSEPRLRGLHLLERGDGVRAGLCVFLVGRAVVAFLRGHHCLCTIRPPNPTRPHAPLHFDHY